MTKQKLTAHSPEANLTDRPPLYHNFHYCLTQTEPQVNYVSGFRKPVQGILVGPSSLFWLTVEQLNDDRLIIMRDFY